VAKAAEAPPARGRGRRLEGRREMILTAALELFREHGFAATGIDEIGEAAGISGPAVYRHFGTKHDILVEALHRIGQQLHGHVEEAAGLPPDKALEHLVTTYVDTAIDQAVFVVVVLREQRALPEDARYAARRRQRLYIEEWVHVLTTVRPDLTDAQARSAVHATMGLIHSAAIYRSDLEREQLRGFLRRAAMGVLTTPVSEPAA
jgi:AcrR family transcriptional regulator